MCPLVQYRCDSDRVINCFLTDLRQLTRRDGGELCVCVCGHSYCHLYVNKVGRGLLAQLWQLASLFHELCFELQCLLNLRLLPVCGKIPSVWFLDTQNYFIPSD